MNLYKNNKGSFKVVYLITIGVIATACVIFGIVFRLGKGINTLFNGIHIGKSNLEVELNNATDNDDLVSKSSSVYDGFSSIDVDIDLGKVNISEGDSFKVDFDYVGIEEPEILVDGDHLIIEQSSQVDVSLFSFPKTMNGHIDIEVPKGTVLDVIKIDTDLGEINIKDVAAGDIDVNAALGNIDIETASGNSLSVDAEMGDIKVEADYYNQYNFEESMGNIRIKGDGGSLVANDSMGNIEIEGEISDIRANSSMGDVEVDNPQDEGARVDISTAMGKVKYNGQKHGTEFHKN